MIENKCQLSVLYLQIQPLQKNIKDIISNYEKRFMSDTKH